MGISIYVEKDGGNIFYDIFSSGTNFYEMRLAIKYSLEDNEQGSRFPILQNTPDREATFTMDQVVALKEEIETIIKEIDNVKEEYKNVPYHAWPGEPPTRDFSFPRDAIIGRLKIILKGCDVALLHSGTLGWSY